jgi:hypothetical protein
MKKTVTSITKAVLILSVVSGFLLGAVAISSAWAEEYNFYEGSVSELEEPVASFHGPNVPGGPNNCVLRSAVGERYTEQVGIISWVKP